jgi:hypothetical protein
MTKNILIKTDVSRDIIQSSSLFKHSKYAVWEYVENGLSYINNGSSPVVKVSINKKNKSIAIQDNGRGMDSKDLERFFTVHGENLDRKMGRKTRGKYGTGGLSAFGIATSLTIDTVKNGKRNLVELSRDYIERNIGKQEIPLRYKIQNEQTNQSNGTQIIIGGILETAHLLPKPIKELIEEKLRIRKNVKVFVDGELCEYTAPSYLTHMTFKPETDEDRKLGEVTLNVYVATKELQNDKRGIAISATDEIHELYNPCENKDYSDRIFGNIDVPLLDDEDSPAAFDQSRNGKLNRENQLVLQLISFISRNVESVRHELVAQGKAKKKAEELKKFKDLDREVSNIINEHFSQFSSEFSKVISKNNGVSDYSELSGTKDENNLDTSYNESLIPGGDIPASYKESEFVGMGNKPVYSTENQHTLLKPDNISPETTGSKIKDNEKIQKRNGGFSVKTDHKGEGSKRASYNKDERIIYINLDHPQLKAAYTISAENVDNEVFKRLYYEIAFTEYVFALTFHKAHVGHYQDEYAALADALEEIDNIARKASKLYQ